MAKMQKKAQKRVVSIAAYRQPRREGVGTLTNEVLIGRWCADFTWKDWSPLLAQLKNELLQLDRAILALTKLSMGRGQLFLSQTCTPERQQGRM